MKLVVSLLLSTGILFGGILIVKESNVTISINGELKNLNKNSSVDFQDGSTLCFKNGSGRVIVNSIVQLTASSTNCIQTTIDKKESMFELLKSFKDSLAVSFSNAHEGVVDGVSSKGTNVAQNTTIISIRPGQDKLIIYSESSGPLPVVLNIKNQKNEVVQSIINENDENSIFIVNTLDIKDNYSMEITNAFGLSIHEYILKD